MHHSSFFHFFTRLSTYLFLSLLVFFTSCCNNTYVKQNQELQEWMAANGKVKVLCTIAMLSDLVKQIGDDHVDCLTLIKGDLDPHSYQLVKGDNEKLSFADIIFYNGLGLEHGPSLHHYLNSSNKGIPVGDLIAKQNPSEIISINGQIDPHIWMDVSLWEKTIPFIVNGLKTIDPKNADDYEKRGQALSAEMLEWHSKIKQELGQIPLEKRFLVTSHDAFNYFARHYLADESEVSIEQWQKRFMAPEGLSPEAQLNPTEIRLLIEHLAKYNIKVLFPESNVSKDSIRKIVDAGTEEGLKLKISQDSLYADAMGEPCTSGSTYLKMMWHNAEVIARHLQSEEE